MRLSRIAIFLLILALFPAASADAFSVPERRKPQFEKDLGYYSITTDPSLCNQVVQNAIDANTYGTVGSLGGTSRLRSYPHDRFTAAHALFYGAEFRWNLTEERHPFDIVIMKDIRTVWQAAFFYEAGTVADKRDELGRIWRSSYGAGLRMVTASGIVFRADIATGKEGVEATIIVGYPWEAL